MKTVVVATPIQLPDQERPPIVGDRIFEGLSEGVIRVNQELMRSGIFPTIHPYDDTWGQVYNYDPPSSGLFTADGMDLPIREYWATAYGSAKRGEDDCDSNAHWLCAWYREVCGVNATAAIYPSMILETADGRRIGRHVVAWIPLEEPIYKAAPWNADKFIRTIIPGKGYIEDPSVALGMYYVAKGVPFPPREPFHVDNSIMFRKAQQRLTGVESKYWRTPMFSDITERRS